MRERSRPPAAETRESDGDRILLPAVPGFVSAFGSVNNENVFIYKQGKTVADVIRSAGLTEDAEVDQAFVLRADGSVVAYAKTIGYQEYSGLGWMGVIIQKPQKIS